MWTFLYSTSMCDLGLGGSGCSALTSPQVIKWTQNCYGWIQKIKQNGNLMCFFASLPGGAKWQKHETKGCHTAEVQ